MTYSPKAFSLDLVEKTALIVTDGAESTCKTAQAIAAELTNYSVISVDAGHFAGTDLLLSSLYFFGAEKSGDPSFSYLFKMLQHINLAGRPCGIFSGSKETSEYLCEMVHDSELNLYPDPFLGEGDITEWVQNVTALPSTTPP